MVGGAGVDKQAAFEERGELGAKIVFDWCVESVRIVRFGQTGLQSQVLDDGFDTNLARAQGQRFHLATGVAQVLVDVRMVSRAHIAQERHRAGAEARIAFVAPVAQVVAGFTARFREIRDLVTLPARQAIDHFRKETIKAGFPGLHVQTIVFGTPNEELLERIDVLSANSVTCYNWGGPHPEDYIRWGVEAMERINKWDEALSIPFFPNASIGWDDSPRFPHKRKEHIVHLNKSPQAFSSFLQKAKDYLCEHPDQPKLITIFAWNEWIEGAYLLPDIKYGFSYLEAVRKVMNNKYSNRK